MQILRYVLVDASNVERDYEFSSYDEAVREAGKYGCAVVECVYEFEDSSLVWTPDGGDTWPPDGAA